MSPTESGKKRILCLCGGFSNKNVLSIQLALEKEATFYLAQGNICGAPPEDVGLFFGPPPNFCWFMSVAESFDNLRNIPEDLEPEDKVRFISPMKAKETSAVARRALDGLYQILEKEGPFDGVLGFSEGACMAGTILVDEQRRLKKEGRPPMFSFGIFLGGFPPLDAAIDAPGQRESFLLADVVSQIIEVPTLHVIGASDAFLFGSLACYNVCDSDTARLYDHGKGHFIPREPELVEDIVQLIRGTIRDATEQCTH